MSDEKAPNEKTIDLQKLLDQVEQESAASSLFAPQEKDGEAAKINALMNRAMRLLSQRDHGEMELRKKLRTPPLPFVKPANKKSSW